MFFEDDNAVYLADFGTDATVGGVACRGIFIESHQEAFGLVSGSGVALIVSAAVTADYDTAVEVNGTAYVVRGIEPDGAGFKRLLLEEA